MPWDTAAVDRADWPDHGVRLAIHQGPVLEPQNPKHGDNDHGGHGVN